MRNSIKQSIGIQCGGATGPGCDGACLDPCSPPIEPADDFVCMYQSAPVQDLAALYNYRHRDYSPTLGRWLQHEPLGCIEGLTLYAYPNDAD
ncbi:MAG: hypothetical protein NTU53_00875 [Planctomycetota bacterium]|nr:hypothetical protein [Planctomycetota bacterium]